MPDQKATNAPVKMSDLSYFVVLNLEEHGDVVYCDIIARSASYVGGCSQNSVSVRPFVRPFVRIIIDFCEEHMNPRHVLLSIGSLKT